MIGHYKFDNETLLYRKNIDDYDFLIYPKIIDRKEIVLAARSFGHFSFLSTLNRLKQKYYWHRMSNDVMRVIKTCSTCLRNQKITPLRHPALALEVDQIHDRCGIDLVFGLPKTKENFIGILVITEYLSKYPYAVPIRSKTAEECAGHLFTYISIFGPMRQLVSDCGKEWVNNVVDHMLKNIGVEHKTTSPYSPATNGQTEKMNSVLIDTLRKLCETNPLDWPQKLKFALMAYRSRINSVTKISPFELVFGRPMNGFENWESSPSKNEIAQILQRGAEIKDLFENKHKAAVENIKKNQVKQKQIQDNRSHLLRTTLEPGTKVFLKCEGLLGKLEPRFSGPFIVVRRTANYNYILNDILGNELKQSYPLHKMKIASSRPAESNNESEEYG